MILGVGGQSIMKESHCPSLSLGTPQTVSQIVCGSRSICIEKARMFKAGLKHWDITARNNGMQLWSYFVHFQNRSQVRDTGVFLLHTVDEILELVWDGPERCTKNVFINHEWKMEVQRRSDTIMTLTIDDGDWQRGRVVLPISCWTVEEKWKFLVSWGVWLQSCSLKELVEGHHQEWSGSGVNGLTWLNGRNLTWTRLSALWRFCGWCCMATGWVISFINSNNERCSGMPTHYMTPEQCLLKFLEIQVVFSHPKLKKNRSVMVLDL